VDLPILLLAAMGLVTAIGMRTPQDPQWPMWAAVLFFIAVHVVTLPLLRYMAPVMPYVLAYAAFFLTSLGRLRQLRLPSAFQRQPQSSG